MRELRLNWTRHADNWQCQELPWPFSAWISKSSGGAYGLYLYAKRHLIRTSMHPSLEAAEQEAIDFLKELSGAIEKLTNPPPDRPYPPGRVCPHSAAAGNGQTRKAIESVGKEGS